MPPLPTQKLLLTSTNGAGQLAKRRSEDCRPPRQPSPQSPHEALFNPFDSELKFSDDSACECQASGCPWSAGWASCSVLPGRRLFPERHIVSCC